MQNKINLSPYRKEVYRNLPRLLSLFDTDQTSLSLGMGDRFFWAWGLIDFNNAAFQGAVNGLTCLWKNNLWPYEFDSERFVKRLDSIFLGARNSTAKDGSLNQAFPREGSYALTAFVAFDMLCAISNADDLIEDTVQDLWLDTVEPMIQYLIRNDETHGVISNHLAGAVAALVRWDKITGDYRAIQKAEELLSRILEKQSTEGWFLEYEGADPGYQSLCTMYLSDVHQNRTDWNLEDNLKKSIRFLWHFAHPDGSFGGVYGSRNTRFYNPVGVLALSDLIPEAGALASFMAKSVDLNQVINLSSVDETNLTPFFNAYCHASVMDEQYRSSSEILLPFQRWEKQRIHFPEAGIIIDKGEDHYTIVNTHKGGVVSHFAKKGESKFDDGVVFRNKYGALASTQSYNTRNQFVLSEDKVTIESPIIEMPKKSPTPFQFLILRILGLTFFRSYHLRELVKQFLVRLLITRKRNWSFTNKRNIYFGPEIKVNDESNTPKAFKKINGIKRFVSIHMASQGYWQIQDEN